jgi:hypothetical protein
LFTCSSCVEKSMEQTTVIFHLHNKVSTRCFRCISSLYVQNFPSFEQWLGNSRATQWHPSILFLSIRMMRWITEKFVFVFIHWEKNREWENVNMICSNRKENRRANYDKTEFTRFCVILFWEKHLIKPQVTENLQSTNR